MSKVNQSDGVINELGMLGVLFVGLKLTGTISWSWWYITLPFWGGLVLVAVIIFFVFLFYAISK